MIEQTCGNCHGSGKVDVGTMVDGIDWSYDFSQGFASMCTNQERKDAARDRCIEFFRTLKSGDEFTSSGQFSHKALTVGMYDGWPFWKPTPAVAYVGPLGRVEYDFYYNISAPYRRAEREAAK